MLTEFSRRIKNDITLQLIEDISSDEWDNKAQKYRSWTVYHSSAWIDFILKTQPVKKVIYSIIENGREVGLMPGFQLNKGPVKIFGSPLPGWTTPCLGPLVNDIDQSSLLDAIATTIRKDRYSHSELESPILNVEEALNHGFIAEKRYTYIANILSDPESILSSYSKSCRKAVKKGQRNGLYVETTHDSDFIDLYYQQLMEVFSKKGIVPTYPKERIRLLWDTMMPSGNLLATWVQYENKVIATRLDLLSKDWMYSFGSASSRDYLHLYPNELARYHVMCIGSSRGAMKYDMNGRGSYKAKFGAESITIFKLIHSSKFFMAARNTMKLLNKCKTKFKYNIKGIS